MLSVGSPPAASSRSKPKTHFQDLSSAPSRTLLVLQLISFSVGRGSASKCPVGTEKGEGPECDVVQRMRRRLDYRPLQDAGVLPAGGDQATVVVQEGHVGHMTAVAAVLVTGSLGGVRRKQEVRKTFV